MGSCCGKDKNDTSEEKSKKNCKNRTSPAGSLNPPTSPVSTGVVKQKSNTFLNNESSGSSFSQKSKKALLFKSEIEDSDVEEKKLMDDEKLEKEQKYAIKGGESAYGKVVRKKESKASQDIELVREFLTSRQYQMMNSIGSGNYAEVFKAFESSKNRYVAVKVIDLQKANENYRVNFLPKEISILRQLKHPGIIKIYEISQTSNKIFMIMEFAQNGTASDWLRDKGSFPEVTAWEMFKKILESLHYMHSLQIAHRDLKLENILITEKNNPKLSDFSYAIVVNEKSPLSTTFCGSLPYFSPEIMQRKPHNPLPSDIWSLGVCFYVMVNDGLPFKISDERAMLSNQLTKNWDFKKRVEAKLSNQLKTMIRIMMEPIPSNRPTTQALIKDPWITVQPKPIIIAIV